MSSETIADIVYSCSLLYTLLTVCGGAALLQKRIDPLAEPADSFLEAGIIGAGWLVLTSTVFGALDIISRYNFFIADAIFLIIATAINYHRPRKPRAEFLKRKSLPLPVLAALISATLIACAAAVWAIISPPPVWDAFVYHLSFPAAWISEGRIFPVTVPFGDQAGTYFPSNTELIYMRIMISAGQDFATNALQCFFLVYSAVAVYRLSRCAGAPSEESLSAAAILFFIPILLHQAVASEVDIVFSALFISALNFVLNWADRPHRAARLFFAFLAIGLFAGVKSISLVFLVLIAGPIFLYLIATRRAWHWLDWGAAIVVLSGGFWYIRNWIVTGNPVFPLSVSISGLKIFTGAYTRWTMLQSVFHTDSFTAWLAALSAGYGFPVLILCALCTIAAFFLSNNSLRIRSIAVIPWLIMFICFFVIPYNNEIRFAFSAFMISCVSVAWVGGRLTGSRRKLYQAAITVVLFLNVIYCSFNGRDDFHIRLFGYLAGLTTGANEVYRAMAPGAAIIAVPIVIISTVFFFSIFRRKWVSNSQIILTACCAITAAGIVVTAVRYSDYQYEYYAGFPLGRSWQFLHKQKPEPVRIAYTGTDLNYGLTGPNLKNNVFYIPITGWNVSAFHLCLKKIRESGAYSIPPTDRIDFCRREPEFDTWFGRLSNARAKILFVSVLHHNDLPHLEHDQSGFPIEREWADTHPQYFTTLFTNPQVRIYSVNF